MTDEKYFNYFLLDNIIKLFTIVILYKEKVNKILLCLNKDNRKLKKTIFIYIS